MPVKQVTTLFACFCNRPAIQLRNASCVEVDSPSTRASARSGRMPATASTRIFSTLIACLLATIVVTASTSQANATPDVLGESTSSDVLAQADSTAARYSDRNQWRYTVDGWKHVDELKVVRTPHQPWLLSACHPMVIAGLLIMAACLLLTLDAQRSSSSNESNNGSNEVVPISDDSDLAED